MKSKYHVIEIVDNKNIIVNYGKRNGAKIGDLIRVVQSGESVIDNKSGANLGELYLIKDTIEVYEVYEQFSLCNKTMTETKSFAEAIGGIVKTTRVKVNINVDKQAISNRNIKPDEPICVGDPLIVL